LATEFLVSITSSAHPNLKKGKISLSLRTPKIT
jgi:hypothetical protein